MRDARREFYFSLFPLPLFRKAVIIKQIFPTGIPSNVYFHNEPIEIVNARGNYISIKIKQKQTRRISYAI
jgi:hypothetical protein